MTTVAEKEYVIVRVANYQIKIDKKVWQEYQQLEEKERSIKLECFYEITETYNR